MLDLSKLEALKLPRKEIEVPIMGERQKVMISAFGDDISLRLSDLGENFPEDGELRCRRLILTTCVEGVDEKTADLLLEKSGRDVGTILEAILNLNDEFSRERERIREQAEKNLQTGAAAITQG